MYYIWETSRSKIKTFCFKNCSDFSLLEKIVLIIWNILQILPSSSNFKSFSLSLEQHFLTVGQNNFGNKIPLFSLFGNGCLTTVWNDKPRTRQQFVNVQTPVDYLLDGSRCTGKKEEAVQSKVTWIVWQVCLTCTATPNRVEQGACREILQLLQFFPNHPKVIVYM